MMEQVGLQVSRRVNFTHKMGAPWGLLFHNSKKNNPPRRRHLKKGVINATLKDREVNTVITVNGKPMVWSEGMTVETLLKEKNYVFAKIVVKINGVYIPPQQYSEAPVKDGDNVQALHMLAGG